MSGHAPYRELKRKYKPKRRKPPKAQKRRANEAEAKAIRDAEQAEIRRGFILDSAAGPRPAWKPKYLREAERREAASLAAQRERMGVA